MLRASKTLEFLARMEKVVSKMPNNCWTEYKFDEKLRLPTNDIIGVTNCYVFSGLEYPKAAEMDIPPLLIIENITYIRRQTAHYWQEMCIEH